MTRRGALVVPGLFDQIKAGLSMLCPSPGEGTGKRLRDASSELAALGIVIKKSLSFAALCIVEGGRKGGRSAKNPTVLKSKEQVVSPDKMHAFGRHT
jgi:hypothetical protein